MIATDLTFHHAKSDKTFNTFILFVDTLQRAIINQVFHFHYAFPPILKTLSFVTNKIYSNFHTDG